MLATLIIFRAPKPEVDSTTFAQTVKIPPPPPAPPPPAGGDSSSVADPTTVVAPPPVAPSIVQTISPTSFNVHASDLKIPNLPATVTQDPGGSAMTGNSAPGSGSGNGSEFGSASSNGTPMLEGYLYDLKQSPSKQPTPKMDPGMYHKVVEQFISDNWNESILRDYYRTEKPLYATDIFIPIIKAEDGPKAFNVENEVQPNMYVVLYKATVVAPQEGTYHFVGTADDILLVRANGKTVLDGCDRTVDKELRDRQTKFQQTNFNPTWENNADFWVGLPVHADAGEQIDLEIIIGEEPGGRSDYFLYIQRDEDTDTKTQSNGSPILPIFQLDPKPIKITAAPGTYPPYSDTPAPWTAATKEGQ